MISTELVQARNWSVLHQARNSCERSGNWIATGTRHAGRPARKFRRCVLKMRKTFLRSWFRRALRKLTTISAQSRGELAKGRSKSGGCRIARPISSVHEDRHFLSLKPNSTKRLGRKTRPALWTHSEAMVANTLAHLPSTVLRRNQ